MSTCRILIFAANPSRDLHLDEEIDEINDALQKSRYSNLFEVKTRLVSKISDVIDCLSEIDPQVVHFSCHNLGPTSDRKSGQGESESGPERHFAAKDPGGEGALIFIKDGGGPQPLSQSALEELFKSRHGRIRLVVLNACQTHSQAEAIRKQIDCVVGTGVDIRDDYARVFSARFYQSLGKGASVQQAYADARFALSTKGATEKEMPVLLSRSGVDARDVFLIDTRRWPMRVWAWVQVIVRRRPRIYAAAFALCLIAAIAIWHYSPGKMTFAETVQYIEMAEIDPRCWDKVKQQLGEVNWEGVVVTATRTGPFASYKVKPAGIAGNPRPDQVAYLNLANPDDFKPLKPGNRIGFKGQLTDYGVNGLRISDVVIKNR